MPSLWRDPKSGIFYANFRIPSDLVSHYSKTHVLKSLRTRKEKDATEKNWELWLNVKKEWETVRRSRSLNTPLSEESIPYLLEEWLHYSLKADEDGRIAGTIPRTQERMGAVYYSLIDELAEGCRTGNLRELQLRMV